ncbi:MAG: hypothetical protein ACRDQA_27320 [Nocardioidaceae bacterium]
MTRSAGGNGFGILRAQTPQVRRITSPGSWGIGSAEIEGIVLVSCVACREIAMQPPHAWS